MVKKQMHKRKIVAFTGIRSEYDLQFSVAKELNNNKNVDFSFIVFGAHLSERFGKTISNVETDGFKIQAKLLTLFDSDSHTAKAKAAAALMNGICDVFENYKPDLIMVSGDREETVIAATVATFLNIPVAHLFGGDKTFPDQIGDIDEQIRHATTKLAHLHFPSHPEHAKRIEMMGEEKWRIHCLGSPALDKFRLYDKVPFSKITKQFSTKVKKKEYAVVIHHSLPNNIEESLIEFENILMVLEKRKITTFLSYPNNDPGTRAIITIIDKYANNPNFILYKNLARDLFIPLIKNSAFLIGNSSMGVMECPVLELPAINVGKRQQGRLNAGNVIFCDHTENAIENAIKIIMNDKGFRKKLSAAKNVYGDGYSGKKIAKVLSSVALNNKLLAKQITY
jgi:GDP/UDP-N,N'-diacetylbacillosamine 2-epimerase (hydrolysing)